MIFLAVVFARRRKLMPLANARYLIMKTRLLQFLVYGGLLLAMALPLASATPSWSNGLTMRITLNHMGTKKEEHITVKSLRLEGLWAGPRDRLLDTSNLGDYLLAIEDPVTNEVLYSRGFNSEFDPSDTWSSVVYSLRFPAPSRSVAVYIKIRNADNVGFHDVWHTLIDPADKSIDKTPLPAGDVTSLLNSGSTEEKIDLSLATAIRWPSGISSSVMRGGQCSISSRRLRTAITSECSMCGRFSFRAHPAVS